MHGSYSDNFGEYMVRDIVKITANKQPVVMTIDELFHNLEQDCWGFRDNGKRVVCTPLSVLAGTDEHHWARIRCADLSYPIVITDDNMIVDGMHRLCLALHTGQKTIAAVNITRQELDSIRI